MAALVNPGGRKPVGQKASTVHLRSLKDVVRSTLALDPGEAIVVQQLACVEPGCPPVETVVAVLGAFQRSWKFATPTADVTPALLRDTLINHPKGRIHDEEH
jgi:hypothetical protein